MKNNHWKVYCIVMLIALTVTLPCIAAYNTVQGKSSAESRSFAEAVYSKSYYELTYSVSGIDTAMSKLLVTKDTNQQIIMLDKLTRQAQLAECALNNFSAQNGELTHLIKFFNQLGDYSSSTIGYVLNGKEFEGDVYEDFQKLSVGARTVGKALAAMDDDVTADGFSFYESIKSVDSSFSSSLLALNTTAMDYPAMIYDGPFSDALDSNAVKGLSGENLTQEQTAEKALAFFDSYDGATAEFLYESTAEIPSYFFAVTLGADKVATLQLSKQGGMAVQFSVPTVVTEPTFTEEECVQKATDYLAAKGYADMGAVWLNNYNSVIYVNFAPIKDGVVYYPDLIKVKIAADSGEAVGMESVNYLHNHTERTLPTAKLTLAQAEAKTADGFTKKESRYALIPLNGSEYYCVEVYCENAQGQYFYYFDAVTGNQINLLKVVDYDSGGTLLE